MNSDQAAQPTWSSYGRGLAKYWGIEALPSIITRSFRGAEIAISDLRVNRPSGHLSEPLPREDAYMMCLVLRGLPENSYWEGGREIGRHTLRRGQIAISDLRREPASLVTQPIHSLLFHLPRAAINAVTEEANVPRIDELHFPPGVGLWDETAQHLGLSLLPALGAPDSVNRLFADYVTRALASHIAQVYGGMDVAAKPVKGGLAPWQVKRAKEMIAGDLAGSTPLLEIAAACGLSVSHFSRAFRRSTGLAPHEWLLQARVDSAKAMLRADNALLSTIAVACGFSDQSHLVRVFSRRVGLSPGVWRKAVAG